jgi:hypothetical protein
VIAGYELKWQVESMLAALEHEKGAGHMTARRLEAIEAQQRIFAAELERMEATGEGGDPVTTNKALGTTAYVGSAGRGRLIA